MKKTVALILCAIMLMTALPISCMTALAVMDDQEISYTLSSDGTYYSVSDYYGDATHVTIPSTFNGLPVTRIGYEAFRFAGIKTVTIPTSITYIADSAFARCDRLESVSVPDTVTYIGSSAFNSCTALKTVKLSSQITTIENMLFRFCENLESVTIPAGVTLVGSEAFESCISLTSVDIPDSVKTFYSNPFKNCTALKTVTIGKSLTNLSRYAFEGCTALESVTISSENTKYIGTGSYVIDVAAKSLIMGFGTCTIPSDGSVTIIGSYAFMGAEDLTEITIPDTITSIGYEAFKDCVSLTSITIPESVRIMGTLIFADCTNLTDIYCEADAKPVMWEDGWISYCNATVHWNSDNKKDKLYGDVDKDGVISEFDLVIIKQIVNGDYNADAEVKELADLTCDGYVTSDDYYKLESLYFSNMDDATVPTGSEEFQLDIEAPDEYKKGDIVEIKVSVNDITAENGLSLIGFNAKYDTDSLKLVNEYSGTGLVCAPDLPGYWVNLTKTNKVQSGSYTYPADDGFIKCGAFTGYDYDMVVEDGEIVFVFIFIALKDSTDGFFSIDNSSAYASNGIEYFSCKKIVYTASNVVNLTKESFAYYYTSYEQKIYSDDAYRNGKIVYFDGFDDSERIVSSSSTGTVYVFIISIDKNIVSFAKMNESNPDAAFAIPAGGFAITFYYDNENPKNWELYNLFIYLVQKYTDGEIYDNEVVITETEAAVNVSGTYVTYYYSDYRIGDVDLIDSVAAVDYLMVKRAYFKTLTLTTAQASRADIDKNGSIDQFDYVCLKRMYFGTYTPS